MTEMTKMSQEVPIGKPKTTSKVGSSEALASIALVLGPDLLNRANKRETAIP